MDSESRPVLPSLWDLDPSLVEFSLIKLFKEPIQARFASREEPLEVKAVAPLIDK